MSAIPEIDTDGVDKMDNSGHVRTPESGKISVQWRWIPARGFRLWVLNRLGCDGLTLPWGVIWLRPSQWENDELRAHELAHAEQVERDGPIWFSIRYLWWLVRHGYWDNPYEVEARSITRLFILQSYPVLALGASMLATWEQAQKLGMTRERWEEGEEISPGLRLFS